MSAGPVASTAMLATHRRAETVEGVWRLFGGAGSLGVA